MDRFGVEKLYFEEYKNSIVVIFILGSCMTHTPSANMYDNSDNDKNYNNNKR
jgi:hypothetical protein